MVPWDPWSFGPIEMGKERDGGLAKQIVVRGENIRKGGKKVDEY